MRRVLPLPFGVLFFVAASAAQSGSRARLVVGEGLNEPFAVDFDRAGRMFIAEMSGNRVSIWDRQAGLTPLATPFNGPHHLITGPDGDIYVADTWARMVRRVDPATGAVTRVAGTGAEGVQRRRRSGDGRAVRRRLRRRIHAETKLYISDLDNRRIRTVNLTRNIVTTVAGNGETGVPVDGEDAKNATAGRSARCRRDRPDLTLERGGHALRWSSTQAGGSAPSRAPASGHWRRRRSA